MSDKQQITAEEFAVTYKVNGERKTVRAYEHGETYCWRRVDARKKAETYFAEEFPTAERREVFVEDAGAYMYG